MWEGVTSWLGVGDAEAAKQQAMDRTTSGEAWVKPGFWHSPIPHIGGLYFVCSPYLQKHVQKLARAPLGIESHIYH